MVRGTLLVFSDFDSYSLDLFSFGLNTELTITSVVRNFFFDQLRVQYSVIVKTHPFLYQKVGVYRYFMSYGFCNQAVTDNLHKQITNN